MGGAIRGASLQKRSSHLAFVHVVFRTFLTHTGVMLRFFGIFRAEKELEETYHQSHYGVYLIVGRFLVQLNRKVARCIVLKINMSL